MRTIKAIILTVPYSPTSVQSAQETREAIGAQGQLTIDIFALLREAYILLDGTNGTVIPPTLILTVNEPILPLYLTR